MWIKRTKVQHNGTVSVYYQLMKTVYENGRSRQYLVASLGKEGEVSEELVRRLAERITDESYLFLPDELLSLFPTKLYGETFLLNKAFEITSLRRFLGDLAEFKGLNSSCVSVLLLLIAYYFFQSGGTPLSTFYKKYYVHIDGRPTPELYAQAFRLLRGTPLVHPGILANYAKLQESHHLKCYYVFHTPVEPGLLAEGSLRLSVLMDGAGSPLHYKRCERGERPTARLREDVLCIYDAFSADIFPSAELPHHYLSRITARQVKALLGRDALSQLSGCRCERRYGDILYGCTELGEYRFIVLQTPAAAGGKAPGPNEYLITNLKSGAADVLNWFFRLDDIMDVYYNIFLPRDLAFLKNEFPPADLIDVLCNIHFLRLFLEHQLSIKLESLNLTARDAFDICRGIRIVPLSYGNRRQLLHSVYTPMETKVLDFLAFN